MFSNCPNLVGGAGSEWEEGQDGIYYAHIDDGEMDPGYFTAKPYAIYDVNANLLTIYNDGKPYEKTGKKFYLNASDENAPGWIEVATEVEKVVFDESFASARPTSTKEWFYDMLNLQQIEGLELLNTSEVTNMEAMFSRIPLVELDLSHFDTYNVTNMQYMFWECQDIKTIYVGDDWNTDNVTEANGWGMFYECRNLVGSMDTEWIDGEWSHWGVKYAHIDGGPSNPGYLSQVPTVPLPSLPTTRLHSTVMVSPMRRRVWFTAFRSPIVFQDIPTISLPRLCSILHSLRHDQHRPIVGSLDVIILQRLKASRT